MAKTIRSLVAVIVPLFVGLSLTLAVTLTMHYNVLANSVLYAAPTAQGSGDCSNWANACTLQTALTGAFSGDEIWVKTGVHKPDSTNRTISFALKNGVALYGGFAGTESARGQRDWQTNVTILSGDIDNNDLNTDGNFIAETPADIQGANSYHVVRSTAVSATAMLDGFVITAGQANGNDPDDSGGGMYNSSSSPTLTNVTFSGNIGYWGGGISNWPSSSPTLANVTFSSNTAEYGGGMYNFDSSNPTLTVATFSGNTATDGGGMYNDNSCSPTLTNIIFSLNSADQYGGGMYNITSSSPTLTDVTFSANTAMYGGGMYNYDSSPVLTHATFSGNTATSGSGGGMYNDHSFSEPTLTDVSFSGNTAGWGGGMVNANNDFDVTLTNVTFSGNTATNYGGGMQNYSSDPTLTNVTFSGNTAGRGGGMYNVSSNPALTNVIFGSNTAPYYGGGGMYNLASDPELTNVTFSGNTAHYYGGGIYNETYSSPWLTNVTFSGNTAEWGGGMYNVSFDADYPTHATLANVILWGDSAVTGAEIYNAGTSTSTVTYSDVQGGYPGTGNINADPLFVDAANGNLRLQDTSPAIDAGDNTAVPDGITTDLDGNLRFVDTPTVPDTGHGTPPIVDIGAYEVQQPDETPPTVVSITRADPNPTRATIVHFIVTFSEAVIGVDTDDFSLTPTGSISGARVTGVSGFGAAYTVTISTGMGKGTLRLDIPNTATITDGAGNALSGLPYTGGEAYTIAYNIFLPVISRNTP